MATQAQIQALIDEIITGGNFPASKMNPLLTEMLTYSPYKVYTALLTQAGTDVPTDNNNTNQDPFIVGVSYYIDVNVGGDFTNIGAASNAVGTYFIATGTTPASWGTSSSVTSNTGAPIVTILENTLGNLSYSYNAVGLYSAYSPDSLFTADKTVCFIASTGDDVAAVSFGFMRRGSADTIYILTQDSTVDANAMLEATAIEIRVYS